MAYTTLTTEKISANLLSYRKSRGYSQTKMGDVFGCGIKCYQHYEYGKVFPPLDTLMIITCEIGCSMEEILLDDLSFLSKQATNKV